MTTTIDAAETLNRHFLEMRWRLLSVAADFDRIQRSPGGDRLLSGDPRIHQLRQAAELLLSSSPNRAEKLQFLFSDQSPPPLPAPNQKSKI